MVTVAAADLVGSASEVAVTVTTAGLGTLPGAVYRPVDEIAPHALPEQPLPPRLQRTAVFAVLTTVAVNCCVFPAATCAVWGNRVIPTGRTTVTVAVADFVGSAADVAVTITCAGLGTSAGAIYRPLDEIVPQLIPEQPLPLTFQVTLVLDDPPTVALNCCVLPVTTFALPGETLMISEFRIVTIEVVDFVGSATEVAVTATCAGLGTAAGAVNKPLDEIEPQVAPKQPAPLSVQVTAGFDVPVTVAENC